MMRLDAPALIADAAPVPKPGRGEILVRIFAAGVTPTELLWYPTTHTRDGSKRSGAVPGHEFSGNHRSSRQRGRVRPDRSRDLWK
jgi:NADPH:quinone reductase-like Zn-dependent oxidoreductase